jgi:hypothetical protein
VFRPSPSDIAAWAGERARSRARSLSVSVHKDPGRVLVGPARSPYPVQAISTNNSIRVKHDDRPKTGAVARFGGRAVTHEAAAVLLAKKMPSAEGGGEQRRRYGALCRHRKAAEHRINCAGTRQFHPASGPDNSDTRGFLLPGL